MEAAILQVLMSMILVFWWAFGGGGLAVYEFPGAGVWGCSGLGLRFMDWRLGV